MTHRLRAILATLAESFSSRFDLATVELEDLLARAGKMGALLLAGSITAGLALLFVGLAVVTSIPPGYRWLVALVFAVIFGAGAYLAFLKLKRAIAEMPAPFSSTRDVLKRDAAAIRPPKDDDDSSSGPQSPP